jgi:cell division protein FtsL
MKKSSKPLIIAITSLLVLITIIILISQGLRLKYEELQRELAQLENQIKTEKTQSVGLKANYQMLTSEDSIKEFAMQELGLVDAGSDPTMKITLSTEEVAQISESVWNENE